MSKSKNNVVLLKLALPTLLELEKLLPTLRAKYEIGIKSIKRCNECNIFSALDDFSTSTWCSYCRRSYFKRRYAEDSVFREQQKQRAKANYLKRKARLL